MSFKPRKKARQATMIRTATTAGFFTGALLVFAGCHDVPDVTSPVVTSAASRAAVIDGAPGDGNAHFFFLPPITPRASHDDAFDASLSPVVEICVWEADACALPLVSRLTNVKVHGASADGGGEHYGVNWHTNGLNLDPAKAYRLRVLVAGTELGSAEIDVIRNGSEKKGVDATSAVPLVAGQTLPIKFRIEQGAVWVIGAAGGSISALGDQVQLDIPAGALTGDVGITVEPTNGAPPPGGFVVAGAIFDFGPHGLTFESPAQLTIVYDEANLPAEREEHELRLLHGVIGGWEAVAGSTVNTQTNTVTGPVTSFSPYAPGGGTLIELSGFGTATLDGAMNSSEWPASGCASFPATLPGGGTTPAKLCIMNDASNLYVGLTLSPPSTVTVVAMIAALDKADDGLLTGDDALGATGAPGGASVFGDQFYTAVSNMKDDADGGSDDIQGKFVQGTGGMTFEMSHPLKSGDPSHDIVANPGDTMGFLVILELTGSSSTEVTVSPAFPDHGHIVITGVDQQQPVFDYTVGGLAIGGNSDQILAQVVTAGRSGKLIAVNFPLACDDGALVVEIQGVTSGQPNGVVLASQTVPAATLPQPVWPTPPSWRSITFATPASVTAGNQFAIVLDNPTGSCGVLQGPNGDPYPGGNGFYDARPNAAGVWLLLTGGRVDLPFQTIVK
jgi:hypothetical protein